MIQEVCSMWSQRVCRGEGVCVREEGTEGVENRSDFLTNKHV